MKQTRANKGDWVEVQRVILEPGQRSPNVPQDTATVPYVARIRGFLVEDREVGQTATIETIIGRRLEGTLVAVNPPYGHDFGRPVPELLPVGPELRAALAEGAEE